VSFANALATNSNASSHLALRVIRGEPLDLLGSIFAKTASVTPAEVQAVATKVFAEVRVAIVGDATAITGDVASTPLGAPEVRAMP
jgi:hypothetical protein